MTSTAFDDQFAVSPEEDALFQERQAHDEEQASRFEREQRDEDDAVEEMMAALDEFIEPEHDFRLLYRAIKAGRIPGVEIKRGDV